MPDVSRTDEPHDDGYRALLRFLVEKRHPAATEIAVEALIAGFPLEGTIVATDKDFAVSVATLLDDPSRPSLQLFFGLVKSNERLAKEVIVELAQSWRFETKEFGANHPESDIADLIIWLFQTFPDRQETSGAGAHWVSSFDQVEEFRSGLLRSLISRGTKHSVAAVAKIATAIPDRSWLRYQLLDARRAMSANTWRHRTPTEIVEFISRSDQPIELKSTKTIIVEAARAFQRANIAAERRSGVSSEEPSENIEISTITKGDGIEVRPRRILAIATEWKSRHGGITTLNREMCVAMAGLGHQVVCVVVDSSDAEKADAGSKHVTLVDAPTIPNVLNEIRLLTVSKRSLNGFEPEVVIGHDHITGAAGLHIAKNIFEVPYVHFVHTLPEGAERHKTRGSGNILDGSKKAEAQKRSCTLADLVVCVGPMIYRIVQTTLQNYEVPVVEFRPGLDNRLLQKKIDPAKTLSPYCLLLARLEDGLLKGADIACCVIATLNKNWKGDRYKRPKLIMRGFEEATIDRDLLALGDIAHARPYILPRGYSVDANEIEDDICMSSVMIMPSRVEAFGLVSLEAIAAGVPVLVTSSSGVGELLVSLAAELQIGQVQADACIADVIDGDLEATTEHWSTKAQALFDNPVAAFAAADKLRSMLIPILSWENAAKKLTSDIEDVL